MKKYILTLICIAIAVAGYCAENNAATKIPLKPIKISISFYVARPALNCEDGFGICNWSAGLGRLGGDGREVSAEAYVENSQLTVQILKSYVDGKMEEELSQKDYYNIGEEVAIPQQILEKMGLKDSYSVAEGSYRIIKYGEYFEVNFDLK
jgi:hypothetical protein